MSQSTATAKSCKPCRERHVKCDRVLPVCSTCQKSRYLQNCTYDAPAEIRFRTWLASSPAPSERPGTRSRPRQQPLSERGPQTLARTTQSPASLRSENGGTPGSFDGGQTYHTQDGSPQSLTSHSDQGGNVNILSEPVSLATEAIVALPINASGVVEHSSPSSGHFSESNLPSFALSPSGPPLAINDGAESYIFKFYLDHAGPWLDITSPSRFFGIQIPCMVTTESVLLLACLAYAAHVLHLQDRVPSHVKEDLHDRALRQLIPRLTSYREGHGTSSDLGPILATTVLLRMTEQFLEPDQDRQHHLYGSSTLFETGYDNWSLFDVSLSSASFWAYLRGSIRVSFLLERPCPFKLDHLAGWESASMDVGLTDEARANVATYLLAEVCTVCWGESSSLEARASSISRLQHALSEWKRHLPPTFQPWYLHHGERDAFPEVQYLTSWHCVAWQFYFAAQIMLAVHSPCVQRTSPSTALGMTKFLEENIIHPARLLCGVTQSSDDPGVKINGSHLIAWSGQFFTGKAERGTVLEMLISMWEETRWPNLTCHERLKELWDGSRRHWAGAS